MKRKRSCGSFELERRKNKFFEDLENEGMTIDKMKEISINNHYSTSMIVDMLFRDYASIVVESKFSRNVIRTILLNNGVKCDNKKYLRLPQEIRVQFKYPKHYSIDEIRNIQKKNSQKGATTTCNIRKSKEHYNPKNHYSYYMNKGYTKSEAEKIALEYRKSKSPFSRSFIKYENQNENDVQNIISDLSRKRGIKGLQSMKSGCSLLEQQVADSLTKRNIKFTRQYQIDNRFSYDFYLHDFNVIIEVNGTYWHADPRIFSHDDIINYPYGSICAGKKWKKDEIKNTYAVKKGYIVEVIWELDIIQEGFLDEYVSKFC